MQDLIIEYRIQEQLKNAEIDADADDDYDDDDANLQRILKQIGVSLHKKYRQKDSSNPTSAKLSDMIQQLYQTLKKTQPDLFTKRASSSSSSSSTTVDDIDKAPSTEETFDDDNELIEEPEVLTPEMQHANTLYHQAMKLINVTTNRQDDAYGRTVQLLDSLSRDNLEPIDYFGKLPHWATSVRKKNWRSRISSACTYPWTLVRRTTTSSKA